MISCRRVRQQAGVHATTDKARAARAAFYRSTDPRLIHRETLAHSEIITIGLTAAVDGFTNGHS